MPLTEAHQRATSCFCGLDEHRSEDKQVHQLYTLCGASSLQKKSDVYFFFPESAWIKLLVNECDVPPGEYRKSA